MDHFIHYILNSIGRYLLIGGETFLDLSCMLLWVGWKIQWELSLSPDFRIIQQHSSPKSRGENSESIALHQPIEGVGFK